MIIKSHIVAVDMFVLFTTLRIFFLDALKLVHTQFLHFSSLFYRVCRYAI